jgi:hypothetical protein
MSRPIVGMLFGNSVWKFEEVIGYRLSVVNHEAILRDGDKLLVFVSLLEILERKLTHFCHLLKKVGPIFAEEYENGS